MKILFFASKLIYGGGQKVRNWLARELINHGHEVYYATSNYDDKYNDDLIKISLNGKVKVVEYPFNLKNIRPLFYWKSIEKIYRENNIELLIIFGGSLIEQIIARKCGVKILLSERCDPYSRPILSRILKKIQYRISDGYVFQTKEASLFYGKRAQRICKIIPNPIIDKNLPEPIYTDLRKEIVTVGRLSPEKNQEMLIKAFSKFVIMYPDYILKIYGDGPLYDYLISKINSYNLSDSVEIIRGERNIVNQINGAEIFVLPSNTEGMPNALIEAMSVGLLSISTNCPIYGPKLLISNEKNGYLVPVNNEDSLTKQMIHVVSNKISSDKIRKKAVDIRNTLEPISIFNEWKKYIENL